MLLPCRTLLSSLTANWPFFHVGRSFGHVLDPKNRLQSMQKNSQQGRGSIVESVPADAGIPADFRFEFRQSYRSGKLGNV